jgi:hypothetical protein
VTQDQAIDNLVSVFETEVNRIVAQARRETLRVLQDRLSITNGLIDRTQANVRTLQRVEAMFRKAMKGAGYDALVREFVRSFNGQFVYFQDVLDTIGAQIGRNITVTFGDRDKALFIQQQLTTVDMLQQAVDIQARSAQQQAMFGIGGVKASKLTAVISEKLDLTAGKASAIADTALSTFYRTVADRGFQQVEASLGKRKRLQIRYRYGGPNDKLTRPFCKHALAATAYSNGRVGVIASTAEDRTYTREEIARMSNGQLPNVMVCCGGFRCRHQWLLLVEHLPNARIQKKKLKRASGKRES